MIDWFPSQLICFVFNLTDLSIEINLGEMKSSLFKSLISTANNELEEMLQEKHQLEFKPLSNIVTSNLNFENPRYT